MQKRCSYIAKDGLLKQSKDFNLHGLQQAHLVSS
jgi:hypothetical protein